jgi:hypothetical protein
MASDRPSGHTDSEYVIGSALKCSQFECIDGQTYKQTYLFFIEFFDLYNKQREKFTKI